MMGIKSKFHLNDEVSQFVKKDFSPKFGRKKQNLKTNPVLDRLRELGTELWLDTGNIEESQEIWTSEFSALTTNNTLLNKEVQTGRYDSLILGAAKVLDSCPQLSEKQRALEIAFVLNAYHALRLVEQFDAYVSVEEHTDLADDVEGAVDYARRYYSICPERFIIKIPFTPAGLLATRKVSAEGIPVNHTLGFSARQNYVIARIGRPAYVNVFLGRLNSFVNDNNLGDGSYVGEKAALASQAAIRHFRQNYQINCRQIGASFRSGKQVHNLAGIDVMTISPKVAHEFLAMGYVPEKIAYSTGMNYKPGLYEDTNTEMIRLDTLWHVDDKLVACVDTLEKENLDSFTPDDLIDFFAKHECGDFMPRWNYSETATSLKEGKIPQLHHWEQSLEEKSIGLDSLMNLAGLGSFTADQKEMDERVKKVLDEAGLMHEKTDIVEIKGRQAHETNIQRNSR